MSMINNLMKKLKKKLSEIKCCKRKSQIEIQQTVEYEPIIQKKPRQHLNISKYPHNMTILITSEDKQNHLLGYITRVDIYDENKDENKRNSTQKLTVQKFYKKKYQLFEKYDEGIQLDEESWYSVTPQKIAEYVADRLKCNTIIDSCSGVGGNLIQFALNCEMTFGFDLDEQKVKFAKENAKIYQVDSEKLRVIKANFITSDIKKILLDEYDVSHVDVCFSSPPWGGVDYIQNLNYSLFHNIEPNGIQEWILKMLTLSKQIAIFVPRQIILSELPTLLAQISYESEFPLDRCSIELEEIYLNGKIIGIMMYYGGNIPKIKKSQEYDYIYEQLQKQPKPWLEENKKQQPFKYKSVIRFISEKVGMVDLLNLVIQSKQNIQDSLNAYEQFEKKILYDDLITEYELQKLKEQDVQSIEAKIQRNIAKKLKKQQLNQI